MAKSSRKASGAKKSAGAKKTTAKRRTAKRASTARKPRSKKATAAAPPPTEDEVRERARQIWEQNGRLAGSALGDWLEAERQLRSERGLA